jgi:hypothetical protein
LDSRPETGNAPSKIGDLVDMLVGPQMTIGVGLEDLHREDHDGGLSQ